eukprot:7387569-Prymnesium_polylepis.1
MHSPEGHGQCLMDQRLVVHHYVPEANEGRLLDRLGEHVRQHVVGAHQERLEDEHQNSPLDEHRRTLEVPRADARALLLHKVVQGLVVTEHRSELMNTATVELAQRTHVTRRLGRQGRHSRLGLARRVGNDLDKLGRVVNRAVVVHDDVTTERVDASAPRAVMSCVETARLIEAEGVRVQAVRDAKLPTIGDPEFLR